MIELNIRSTAAEIGELAADRIASVIKRKPHAVVGVATGSSPIPVYQALARLVHDGLDVSRVTWFALDEYIGLPTGHPESYREVLLRDLVRRLGIEPSHLHTPATEGTEPDESAASYEREIVAAGGIDIQLTGIGANGHIGFNEPGTPLDAPTHVAHLAEQTRRDNARFFNHLNDVPARCITQGVGTIARAREIVLVARGEGKARAVADAALGPVSPVCPASVLQRHPHVSLVLDTAAASALTVTDGVR